MPELPEVQTIVQDLIAAGLVGQAIVRAEVRWPAIVATPAPPVFRKQLVQRTIRSISRRAKMILFCLDDGGLLAVHLRMTGRFMLAGPQDVPDKHVHVVLELGDGRRLWFHDTRKFGRFYLMDAPGRLLEKFGPEPLDSGFTAARLTHLLAAHRRQIKPMLLDQSVIAGLGNIYVDEALWAASIHPLRKADSLTQKEVRVLHRAIRRVLRQGVRNGGTTLGRGQGNFYSLDYRRGRNAAGLKVFRRTGEPCARCGEEIRRIMVGQRGTHICAKCQR